MAAANTFAANRHAQRGRLREIARHWREYLCISPFFILFAIFFAFPIAWAFMLSFQRWDGIGVPRWVGWDNYAFMLRDRVTRQVLGNTLIYLLILLPLELLLPLVFGVLLNLSYLRLRSLFRTFIFLPVVTSAVIVGIVFKFVFGGESGWLNNALALVGLGPYPWLKAVGWAYVPIVTLTVWGGLGYSSLIVLGGLQSIDQDVYEAARIDGASPWQIFWRITLPLMRPIMIFLLITSTIGMFRMFGQPYVLTNGGPANSTLTPLLHIFNLGIGGRIGDSAAFSFLLSLLILVVTLIQLRVTRTRDE